MESARKAQLERSYKCFNCGTIFKPNEPAPKAENEGKT